MIGVTLPLTAVSLTVALARDPIARRQPRRLAREAYVQLRGPLFRGLFADLARYLRPGFHPDDIDTTALLERWQAALFGAEGALVDHLK
jgi:predicted metal-dependent hydrolase